LDSDIRLYFDESVEIAISDQIKKRGVDAVTVRDLQLLGDSDINHLQRAHQMGRVLCSYDTDFLRLDSQGVKHAGVIFGFHDCTTYGEWISGLELICGVLTAADMHNHVEYL
jgi:predicted nuclease of predicted toxin-antitoxin system